MSKKIRIFSMNYPNCTNPIKLLRAIFLSLTCGLVVWGMQIQMSEARSMSPQVYELMKKPPNDADKPVEEGSNIPIDTAPHATRVWQSTVPDIETWKQLAVQMRDFEFSKFVINFKKGDIQHGKIYFVDSHVFKLHSDFVLDYLQKKPRTRANEIAYNQNYNVQKPEFVLGYLTHYPHISDQQNAWVFSFWEGDAIDPVSVIEVSKKLKETFTVAALKFRPDSSKQELVAAAVAKRGFGVVSNQQLYENFTYQGFQNGSAIGRLRIVPATQKIENLTFDVNDIVILQQSYSDISPVSGIITTQFSTPLSHVNLRAGAWGIPNAALKTAATDFANLNGQWVVLIVDEQKLNMRAATDIERKQKMAIVENQKKVVIPQVDLNFSTLSPLQNISLKDMSRFGAKTCHLGVMRQASMAAESSLNIPDGFGIPFSYYLNHLRVSGADKAIAAMLADRRFSQDKAWRKQTLLAIQEKIKVTPIDATQFSLIIQRWQTQLNGAPVFARSSTNAEDLPGFNGAGLYDSVPNLRDEKALEVAIKQVWASLWNDRAVNERLLYNMPQDQVYASVLVQNAVKATAAGVLLTTDIWGHQPRTFTINAKWGLGMRVVEGQKIAEQILYDTGNYGTRVLSRSDESTMLVYDAKGGLREVAVPNAKAIITESRARMLGEAAIAVERLFPNDAVLDIEWVLEGEKFWLVQARPFVSGKVVANSAFS